MLMIWRERGEGGEAERAGEEKDSYKKMTRNY